MTVAELIEELRKYPEDMHVVIFDPDDYGAIPALVKRMAIFDKEYTYYFVENGPERWMKLEVVLIQVSSN